MRVDIQNPRYSAQGPMRHSLVEAIQMYKLSAGYKALLHNASVPVLLLDATSLVSSRACFEELLHYKEDIVISAEPKRGCPPGISFTLGAVGNTGVTLLRQGALGFLRAMLFVQRGHYQHHCYEQEAFNAQLVADGFSWLDFPYLGTVPPSGAKALRGYASLVRHAGSKVRFLNYSHWPRNYRKRRHSNQAKPQNYTTWFAEAPELTCLFHPGVYDKRQHIAVYSAAGKWYL